MQEKSKWSDSSAEEEWLWRWQEVSFIQVDKPIPFPFLSFSLSMTTVNHYDIDYDDYWVTAGGSAGKKKKMFLFFPRLYTLRPNIYIIIYMNDNR